MVTSRKPSKRPSMFEVAKLAGVSHQTVSRVINDSPDVSRRHPCASPGRH